MGCYEYGQCQLCHRLDTGYHTLTVTDGKNCTASFTFYIKPQYILAVTLASDSVTCNGGNNGVAFVSQLNGNPVYTYQWSPASSATDSVTGLAASTQSITVTDMYGCTATNSVVVGQPGPITDVVGFSNPLCTSESNGKVWVGASGTVDLILIHSTAGLLFIRSPIRSRVLQRVLTPSSSQMAGDALRTTT